MNQVISFFKRIRLSQVFTAFLASVLLFFTQACNAASATAPKSLSQPSVGPNSETYVPKGDNILNPVEGGMNNFSDRDPRATSDAKARAQFLKENAAQEKAEKSTNNPAEAIRRVGSDIGGIGKNVQQKAEDVGNKAQGTAEDFTKGTKQGLKNIQGNVQDAGDYAKDTAQRTAGASNPIDAANKAFRDAD
ncbi:hypothetical protein CEN50_02755 [Fischerella thermalis CCMEE 5268]|uniref:CsbD family protein n=1 Tax=Fischerella thermalis CCMEE 5268 TaxID=2019662 RepID=A0A2N6KL80_9CYAN|nr:DUF6658 family protein [Fischerella thermalis]PMB00565.1 hypothetical protein CEN50_02755 [Fischerella thermalis CCMEE 5268]